MLRDDSWQDDDQADDAGVRALTAAGIAVEALGRDALHMAFAAAQEAARAALLRFAHVLYHQTNEDPRLLTVLAAASPNDFAGRADERQALLRRALCILGRLPPPPSARAVISPALLVPVRGDASRPTGGKPRVLVVEDEWFIAAEIAQDLEEVGIDVLGPVATVSEALLLVEAAAKDGGISAAVLDVNLRGELVTPVADALAAIRVPFVYATGYDNPDRGWHFHDGAPLLVKPVDQGALIRTVLALAVAEPGTGPALAPSPSPSSSAKPGSPSSILSCGAGPHDERQATLTVSVIEFGI